MAITGNPLTQVTSANRAPASKEWSIACWVKAAAVPSGGKYSNVAYIQTNATNSIGTVYIVWDNLSQPFSVIGVSEGPSYPFISFGSAPSLNTWVHLAAVFNGSTLNAYRNGASVGSVSMTVTNTPTLISCRAANALANGAAATVADCGAWNATLTAGEIAAMGVDQISAGAIRRGSLFSFIPFIREQIDWCQTLTGGSGNTASEHPRLYLP